ncbi:UvrD-helicase domain-containing protein [Pedobacter steynii]|uniref:DNA 3'-5' helicase II n=1 Tax=Pedobacter steynii TaxID=430522 RepID=A0A1D7QMW3_9SPHI|nr:UvrD-helicase domain-containing protein [Pedobacter steynii]AOM80001.1 hypothetical protein BFS30_24275 [Pedobacter steynii]
MPLKKNKLLLAAAGSGKTTHLVKEALKIKTSRVLITTYTEANEEEIRKKIYEINGFIPENIIIQTWFSFLIQHGVKPYQGVLFEGKINGMLLVSSQSGVKAKSSKGFPITFSEEKEFDQHYFNKKTKIFSDKISKFVQKSNEASAGKVIKRIERIFSHIFIDEVQDMAGYDLELFIDLFKSSVITTLIGDPRQVTYLTHNPKKHPGYKNGKIKEFIIDKCSKLCEIDETTLMYSHRNNAEICKFASKLYPQYVESAPCVCNECRDFKSEHIGIYLVKPRDIPKYQNDYNPIVLRYQLAEEPEWNFGNCKGLGFDRVLIHPTAPIIKYLKTGTIIKNDIDNEKEAFIPKFYVALTRARHSVGIVVDYGNENYIDGIIKWIA